MTSYKTNNLPSGKLTIEEYPTPPMIRMINEVGAVLAKLGVSIPNVDVDKIKAKVQRTFGQDSPSLDDLPIAWDGYQVMLDDIKSDPNHTMTGKISMISDMHNRLVTTLKLERYARDNPAVMAQPITRPLFITGFPRTGTTLLQRLLARDPQMRAPVLWELVNPIPEPGETSPDARIEQAVKRTSQTDQFAPALNIAHPMATFEPDECVFLLQHSHFSLMVMILPKYRAWLDRYDMRLEYERYARFLKVMQHNQPGKTWVLKSPFHMHGLDALLDTFSDAMVIQTHRAPSTLFPSWASLSITAYALGERHVDVKWIANWWLDVWEEQLRHAEAARAANPTRFIDVHYGDLYSKPIETLHELYERLGLTLSDAAVDAMRGWLSTQVRAKFHEHRYTLDQFGLDKAALNKRFAAYVDKYDIPMV